MGNHHTKGAVSTSKSNRHGKSIHYLDPNLWISNPIPDSITDWDKLYDIDLNDVLFERIRYVFRSSSSNIPDVDDSPQRYGLDSRMYLTTTKYDIEALMKREIYPIIYEENTSTRNQPNSDDLGDSLFDKVRGVFRSTYTDDNLESWEECSPANPFCYL